MLTRRDALKFAALAAATSAPIATLTPAEATRLLDEPMGSGPAPVSRRLWDIDPEDPVSFAEGLDGIDLGDICTSMIPEDLAAYYQARAGVLQELPVLAGVGFDHPWCEMDAAAIGMACRAWMAGVRAGACYEQLRQALVGPRRVCRRCQGIGSLAMGADRNHATDMAGGPQTCPDCGGAGTVTAPAAVIG